MYALLIVDDEKWVRKGLRLTIDWEAEGIEVLGEARDGEEALRMIEERTPDFIISDIKMPRMDGLALLEAVKARRLPTKMIMISGYSDFSYAQKALKCGVVDYVLKPIEETQILGVIRKCVDELKQEQDNHRHLEQITGCMRESLPLARQRFLEDLLLGENGFGHSRDTTREALDIRLNPDRLQVIAVHVYAWGANADDPGSRSLLRYGLGNMAEEIGALAGEVMACPLDEREEADLAILLSSSRSHDAAITDAMNALMKSASQYLNMGITIGVSRERTMSELPASFREAVSACAYAFYEGYGKVYEAARRPASSALPSLHPGQIGPPGWDSRLVHAIKLNKDAMVNDLAEELFQHIRASAAKYAPLTLRKGVENLLQEVEQKLEAGYQSGKAADHDNPGIQIRLRLPWCSVDELQSELPALFQQLLQVTGTLGNRKRVIELALDYLEAHAADAVTMNGVAEHFYLNPSYFSKLFHEETGETFSKCLARFRIDRAKLLLKDTKLKVYEVAEKVGYQDFRHFTKVFKEQEGITPGQYRDVGIS
ncbi:response regulator transcription factor [Paenibacillus sacheonensis]|uniref:Response regulator n=1 Tax=Paenibacillus sacheonensis TaxID=742054 RepID=A0A7X4YUE9_9BACL|nr:response regulator [Paenibacillus sacheonensis]MBM7568218.1 AraC-like DNA-binding protein/FixJ family two-component response regulator [Paenibacillus sacheonensis]NBC71784.1 response regulator [Paenibacillus sacheonensis]